MKKIYDSLLQIIADTWGQFIAQASTNPEDAIAVRNIFQQDIYLYALIYLLVFTILALFYYYFILNRKNGSGMGFKLRYWVYTWIVTTLLLIILTSLTAYNMVDRFLNLNTFKFCIGMGIVNAIYIALAFFVGSLLVKRFSVANRTPF